MGKPSITLMAAGAAATLFLAASMLLALYALDLSGKLSSLEQKQAQTEVALSSLQSDYASLNTSLLQAKAGLSEKNSELFSANAKIAMLAYQLNETALALSKTQKELAESRTSLENQKQKAEQIASDLSGLEKNINESMSWFKVNAAFPENHSWAADIYIKRVLDDCVEKGELNLGCMSYLMENTAFAIHYRTDIEKGKIDFLQSVKQTIEVGWGDCEDYSLLFKAALNTLGEKSPSLEVVAWESGGEGNFYIYPKESLVEQNPGISYWIVPNAHKKKLGTLGSLSAYVVCYRQTETSGHCTVALSPEKITSSAQAESLQGAQIFEPQNGRYLGSIGAPYSLCNPSFCSEKAGAVQIIISDSDLYKFERGGWVGYSDYLSRVAAAKGEIISFT